MENRAAGEGDALPGGDDLRAVGDREARAGTCDRDPHRIGADFEDGPLNRISSAAVPGALPTSALPSRKETGSSAPETGTPSA